MSAALFNGIIAAHAEAQLAAALSLPDRPAEPVNGDDVWYRGWEVGYHDMAATWSGEGWCAYQGGCDVDALQVSARTFAECLDAIDDECGA